MPRSTRKRRSVDRAAALAAFTFYLCVWVASVAIAHPSDFRTLTIDLLFGAEGLDVIDAAVVEAHGPSYEPFPSVEQKEMVAQSVLDALGLGADGTLIDAQLSERYHEVGFTVTLPQPAQAGQMPMQFDTSQLQGITSDLTLEVLKLSACAVDASTFASLEIDASRPGRSPGAAGQERSPCEIWALSPEDPPVSIAVTSSALPSAGADIGWFAVGVVVVLGLGMALTAIRRRQRRLTVHSAPDPSRQNPPTTASGP